MSDPTVDIYKAVLLGQTGGGLDDIRVYSGSQRYQYGQGFGDVLRSVFRTVVPVVLRVGKTFFKTSASALKDGGSIESSLKSALKPTIKTALKHGAKAINKVIEEQEQEPAPPPGPPLLHQDERDVGTTPPSQGGSGHYKRKRRLVYKLPSKHFHPNYNF